MASFRTIVLLCALIACLLNLVLARPSDDVKDDMDLRQTVENTIATFYRSVDELKTNPVVMDINQYGSQAFFAVYKGALDLIRLLIPLASPDAHVEGEGDVGAE